MFLRYGLLVLLTLMTLLMGCNTHTASSDTLKIGSMARVFDVIAYVAQEEGLYEKHGIEVEIVPFQSTIEMNTALLTGELDGIIQDVFEAVNMNKEKSATRIAVWSAMPRMFEVVTSSQSNIKDLNGLKGKEVAIATSTIMEYGLDRLLDEKGLSGNDVVKVNIPVLPMRLEALNQGQVPAAILTPPLSDVAVLNGGTVVLSDIDSLIAGPGLIFSVNSLDKKHDAIGKYITSWQQAVELINNEPGKYQALFNQIARIPENVKLDIPHFPQPGLPQEADIDAIVSWMIEKGIMSTPLKLGDVVETSYLTK